MAEPEGFRVFVATRSSALLRTAWFLTGDWASAQDLVQTALVKTWSRWEHLQRPEAPEAYVRRVMMSTFLSWRRTKASSEVPLDTAPERFEPRDDFADADLRSMVSAELAALPRRQRATVVLRYFDDLTEAQAAVALGCSVGTVKSQTAKALMKLRQSSLGQLLEREVGSDTP